MFPKLLEKYKNHPYAKYFKYSGLVLIFYICYSLYVWSNTQATDNAYIDADISLVSAEVSGTVENVVVSDNTPVKKGDIIAEINDSDIKANYEKAEADVKAAMQSVQAYAQKILIEQTNLEKNKELLNLAKYTLDITTIDFNRTTELSKDNFASKKLLDNARVALEKAKSDVAQKTFDLHLSEQNILLNNIQKSAEDSKLQSLIQIKNLKERALANTKIRSPIDGLVANSSLKLGNYIREGVPLFSVVPEKIYVKANFKETQIIKFRPGMKACIEFDSMPKNKIYGTIRNISPATGSKFSLLPPDNATGNFTKIVQRVPILIDFELPKNTNFNLVPGMSTLISVRVDQ